MSGRFVLADNRTGEVEFDGVEASRRQPCPICAALHRTPSWCLVDPVRRMSICPRVESPRRIGEAGWLHSWDGPVPDRGAESSADAARRSSQAASARSRRRSAAIDDRTPQTGGTAAQAATRDWEADQARYRAAAGHDELDELAESLPGVDAWALERMGWGRDESAGCWTVPMIAGNRIVGHRRRFPDGARRAVRGSKGGLMLPLGEVLPHGKAWDRVLWITESETDTAALLRAGAWSVARPGARACFDEVRRFVGRRDCIVAGQRDWGIGHDAAMDLAASINAGRDRVSCWVVAPPENTKDFRDAVANGMDRETVRAIVRAVRGYD